MLILLVLLRAVFICTNTVFSILVLAQHMGTITHILLTLTLILNQSYYTSYCSMVS